MVFINLEDAHELLNTRGLSEVALVLRDRKMLFAAAERFDELLDDEFYAVRTWRQASRSLVQMLEMSESWLLVYVVVVFLGAAFGIVNTMLMAVFERTHEFGILRAIGTGRWALFRLVIYEALFLSVIGTVLGLLLIGLLHVSWLNKGLDLSIFEASLTMFGSDVVIKPAYRLDLILETIVIVMLMSVLASIWPALRAALLQPAETMRE
jgi:ABC-type lipoprotein release transport system permease subunit